MSRLGVTQGSGMAAFFRHLGYLLHKCFPTPSPVLNVIRLFALPPPQRVVSFALLPVGGWGEETGDNSDFTLIQYARFLIRF